jgi:hypothetical protein
MSNAPGLLAFGRYLIEPNHLPEDDSRMYSALDRMSLDDIRSLVVEIDRILAAPDPRKEMLELWGWQAPYWMRSKPDAIQFLADARKMAIDGVASGEFDGSLADLDDEED